MGINSNEEKILIKIKEKNKLQPWLVIITAGFFYLYEMVLRASSGVMTQEIMSSFFINATEYGLLSSFYYYAYTVLQIPSGLLTDKFGAKIVITVSCVMCAVGSYFFAYTESLLIAKIARLIIGAGSACAFIGCLKLAGDWFAPSMFAFIAGLINMLGTIGGTFAGVPLAIFVNKLGWREATLFLAYLGVFTSLVCYFFIKNKPTNFKEKSIPTSNISVFQELKILFLDKTIVLAGLIGGLMYLPISSFAELWAVPFLMKTLNINNEGASFASSMIFIGMAIGSPLLAKAAIKKNSYIKIMKMSSLFASLIFFASIFAKYLGYWPVFVLMLFSGILLGGQVLCFSIVKDRVPNKISATAMAFTNMLVMIGGIIFQPMIGFVLDYSWKKDKILIAGARIYSAENYEMAILAIPVFMLVAYLMLFLLKDKN